MCPYFATATCASSNGSLLGGGGCQRVRRGRLAQSTLRTRSTHKQQVSGEVRGEGMGRRCR